MSIIDTQPTNTSLTEKTALITGAAAGIGEAIAHLFAKNGARVFLLDRDAEPNQAVAASADATYLMVAGLPVEINALAAAVATAAAALRPPAEDYELPAFNAPEYRAP